MNQLVSIIMVVYNSEEFLDEAIESVLNCDYKNIELLLSDDNSTDDSWEIISSYKDPRIKAVRNNVNLGEYKNRNATIKRAKGKYFVFVDGDDTLLKYGLEEAVSAMEKCPLVACGINRPKREEIKIPTVLNPQESYRRHYFNKSQLNYSFARNIFRTDIIKANKLYLPLNVISGDDFIRLQLAAKYDTLLLPKAFALWRKREGQASQIKNRSIKGFLEPHILNHYFLCLESCPLSKKERILALRRTFFNLVKYVAYLIKKGKYLYASTLFKKLPYFCKLKSAFVPEMDVD